MFAFIAILSCCLSAVNADFEAINGYEPKTDVSQHAKIDLDFDEISTALSTFDFQKAYDVYSTGGNSIKSDGVTIRTIKGFSVSTLKGDYYTTFKNYWGSATYADDFTSSACATLGTGEFEPSTNPAVTNISKVEGCLKGAVFQNIWMYVIHEMAEAVIDCNAPATTGSHWDEAVAFYAGSTVGPTGANRGNMPYATAVKRCSEFGTCSDDENTKANVNVKIFNLFASGQDYYLNLQCTKLQTTMDSIVAQMLIPNIQGLLRYAYYVDLVPSEKGRAELWSFAAAVLPMLNVHNPTVATTVKTNSLLSSSTPMSSGYATIKAQIESLYPDLGITCAEVGGLVSTTTSSGYIDGMSPCSDTSTVFTPYYGYTPKNDVSEHAQIELDVKEILTALDTNDFAAARTAYTTGGNSIKTTGAVRTIQGFSKDGLAGEYFAIYKSYWKSATYADDYTSGACAVTGTGVFTPNAANPVIGTDSKLEGCPKGAVFFNIWMYITHEMAEAVADCNDGIIGTHWDEAVAFYAGSDVGSTPGTGRGNMPFATAVKRCAEFGTCSDETTTFPTAIVNDNIFELFNLGQAYEQSKQCTKLQETMDGIVTQMLIPHFQGLLKYVYYVDVASDEEIRSELWAFAAAILPMIDKYNPTAAALIKENTLMTNPTAITASRSELKAAIESVYEDLGITCADVGGLLTEEGSTSYMKGMGPCSDSSTSSASTDNNDDEKHMPEYGIGLLVFFFLVIGCCLGLCTGYWYANRSKTTTNSYTTKGDSLMYSPNV